MLNKFKLSLLLSLTSLFSAHAYSQSAEQVQVPQNQEAFASLGELGSSTILAKSGEGNTLGTARAPASPLTQMWVYAVGSTNCDWEGTVGLYSTVCNHGGTQLRAAVLEIGYGSGNVAWMNGGVLPSSAMYASTPVCVTGGYYSWPCTAGQSVVGFLNEYKLDGNQNGIFKYQNTSSNSPWNTMTVQISIL